MTQAHLHERHLLIRSVLGDVEPAQLGPTDCHDHLLIRAGGDARLDPGFQLDDVDAAVREVESLMAAGGAALVDCMPLGAGRDADGLAEVARRTGLTVVAVTGFHADGFYGERHWVRGEEAGALAELLVSEAEEGMGTSPHARPGEQRSSARAGAIKVATSGERPTPLEERTLDAVGAAAARTGLPVITHTESVAGARAQLERLAAHGVAPDRVVLSHMDRHGSDAEVAEVCASGATVCLDWMGRLDRRPDEVIVERLAALIEAGCGDRVVLGQDLARRSYWRAFDGGPGLAHMFEAVVPLIRRMGVGARELQQVLVDTPRRVLARVAPTEAIA